jgi:hypothetical protein
MTNTPHYKFGTHPKSRLPVQIADSLKAKIEGGAFGEGGQLVEEYPIIRHGIKGFLQMETDMRIVGEAVNGFEALSLIGRARPDIILADLYAIIKRI